MKQKHAVRRFGGIALLATAMIFGSPANADPVTQLIHFDDASNGWKWYSDVDNNFLFDPTNLQSSTLCADSTMGGNGSCVIETRQGVLPRMTRPEVGPTLQGSSNRAPVTSGANLEFTLDSFYFLLTGRGEFGNNYINVTGSNGAVATFLLGQTYTNIMSYDGGGPAGALDWNTGYVATFDGLFENVTSIQFGAYSSAQIRLDCVVATFDGTTSQPLSSYSGGCGGPSIQVPEPGTLALLGLGLFGIGMSRRRKPV